MEILFKLKVQIKILNKILNKYGIANLYNKIKSDIIYMPMTSFYSTSNNIKICGILRDYYNIKLQEAIYLYLMIMSNLRKVYIWIIK